MTGIPGIRADVNVGGAAQGAAAAPDATPAPSGAEVGDNGILVSNPSGSRNFLRWGGLAAGVLGAGALIAGAVGRSGALRGASNGLLGGGLAAATIGATMLGISFIGGLQPKYKPLMASNIGNLEDAQARAAQAGDDVAIVRQNGGKFGLVDYSEQDFDNADLNNLKLDSQNIGWEGAVSKDGDYLHAMGNGRWQLEGRAHPDAIDAGKLSPADAGSLAGQHIGANSGHAAAQFGNVIGDPAGYANFADASKAAADAGGPTAITRIGDKFVLLEARMPNGVSARDLHARGTALNPVSSITLEDGAKLFRPGNVGGSFGFAGRATPFADNEPIGHTIAGSRVDSLVASSADHNELYANLRNNEALTDAVFFGRAAGAALLRSQDPDGSVKFHLYNLGQGAGGSAWDEELASVDARLGRNVRTDHQYARNAPYGVDSEWAIDQAFVVRTDLQRTTVTLTGETNPLRDSQWVQTKQEMDWPATERYRQQLRDDLYYRQHPGTATGDEPLPGTSNGDEPLPGDGGVTGPGDGPTGPGDEGGVVVTPPNDGGTAGGDEGSGTAGGDEGGTSPTTPPTTPPATPPTSRPPSHDSTGNGNADESDF